MLAEFMTAYVVLWALAYAIGRLPRFRDKLTVVPFAVFMWREKPPRFLEEPAPGLLRPLLNAGIAASFGMMAFALYILIRNLAVFAYEPAEAAPVIPLIPGLTIRLESIPYFLVAFGVIAIVHEGAHAIAMRVEGVRIRSFGVLVLACIFGAFVEVDPDSIKQASTRAKLRIYGAGSASNIALSGICLLLAYLIPLPELLLRQIAWIFILSLFVAIFNMLPLHPLDGSHLLSSIVENAGESVTKVVKIAATSICLALIVSNLALTFWHFGLIRI